MQQTLPPVAAPAAIMSCNNNANTNNDANTSKRKTSNASYVGPATLWEHYVLHKAAEKKLRIFNLEIHDKKPKNKSKDPKMQPPLDAATESVLKERQRSFSAPAAPKDLFETTASATSARFPSAFLASIDAVNSLSTTSGSNFTTRRTTPSNDDEMVFGTPQDLALTTETLHDDAERQANLVRTRATKGLTFQQRLEADEGLQHRRDDSEVIMSGALDFGDVRCEVCAARERVMLDGGLGGWGMWGLWRCEQYSEGCWCCVSNLACGAEWHMN